MKVKTKMNFYAKYVLIQIIYMKSHGNDILIKNGEVS